MYSLSGYPYPLGAVSILAPSQDYLKSLREGFAVQVLAPSQDSQCAVLVTRDLSIAVKGTHAPFVTCRQAEAGHPLCPVQLPESVLQSIMDERTKQHIHQVYAVDLNRRAIADKPVTDTLASSQSVDAARQKYVDRLHGGKQSLRVLLPGVAQSAKAKEFGTITTKMQKLQTDIMRTPYAQDPLMEEVQAFLAVLQSCFDLVRPLSIYVKSQKKNHLDKLVTHMEPVVVWARRENVGLNEMMESTYTKVTFFDTQRRRGCHAAVLKWQQDTKPPASLVAADCVLTVLYEMLQVVPVTEEDVRAAKADISQGIATFSVWCAAEAPPDGPSEDLVELNEVLQHFKVFVDAAVPSAVAGVVSPAMLRSAFEVIETRALARKLKDGIGHHFGALLCTDARALLLQGEMDDQYSAEFVDACSNVFDLGVSGDGGVVALAPSQGWSGLSSFRCMKDTVCEALVCFKNCVTKWTAVRLCDELASLCEVLTQLSLIIAVCDRLLWEELWYRVHERRQQWEGTVACWKIGEEWPPVSLEGDSLDCSSVVAEPFVVTMAESILTFVSWVATTRRLQENDVKASLDILRDEAAGCLNNNQIRVALMDECQLIQELLGCEVHEATIEFDRYILGEPCILKVAEGMLRLRDRCEHVILFVSSIVAERSEDAVISVRSPAPSSDAAVDAPIDETPAPVTVEREVVGIHDIVLFCNSFLDPLFCNWVDKVHISACLETYVGSFLQIALPVLRVFVPASAVAEEVSLLAMCQRSLDRVHIDELAQGLVRVVNPDQSVGCQDMCQLRRGTLLARVSESLLRLLELRVNGPAIRVSDLYCGNDDDSGQQVGEDEWDRRFLIVLVQAMTQCVSALQVISFLTTNFLTFSNEVIPTGLVVGNPSSVAGAGNKEVSETVLTGLADLTTILSTWSKHRTELDSCANGGRCCITGVLLAGVHAFALEVWRPYAVTTMCVGLSSSVAAEIVLLKKEIPNWSDWITMNKYNAPMARRHLVCPDKAGRLLQFHTLLHTLVASVCGAVQGLGLTTKGVGLDEVVEEAETALDHGRTTMAVLAAVGLVEQPPAAKKTVEVSDKAKKVLGEAGVPASLRNKLQEIVHTV